MRPTLQFFKQILIVILTNVAFVFILFAAMLTIEYLTSTSGSNSGELQEAFILAIVLSIIYSSTSLVIFLVFRLMVYVNKSKARGLAPLSTFLVCASIFIYFSFTSPDRPVSYNELGLSLSPTIPASITFLVLYLIDRKNKKVRGLLE